jgi:DNA-binding SARP family transcriptional activator
LRQFEQCAAALEEELGVKPSKGTVTLYEQIQADQLDEPEFVVVTSDAVTSNETSDVADTTNTPLLEILGQLTQLQTALSTLQKQVQHSIQKVERTLSHYL